ncbi:MAG: DUF2950 family protein [Planctomycetes bacterium]|nr:DUF2950 family protein [Planctomycetota bacterium]
MKQEVTLIQIMVVISVLAVVAILAIPNVLDAKQSANETTAITTLKYVAQAQESFREEVEMNEDQDDSGEYGTFAQLSGVEKTSRGHVANPPYLDERFRQADPEAAIEIKGYRFRLFLPDRARRLGSQEFSVTDEREAFWCAYAWPVQPGKTGRRVFFIHQYGLVYARDAAQAPGPPVVESAYRGDPFVTDLKLPDWMVVQ